MDQPEVNKSPDDMTREELIEYFRRLGMSENEARVNAAIAIGDTEGDVIETDATEPES